MLMFRAKKIHWKSNERRNKAGLGHYIRSLAGQVEARMHNTPAPGHRSWYT